MNEREIDESIMMNGIRWITCDREEWEAISMFERFALVSSLDTPPYLYFKQDPTWSKDAQA